MAVTDRLTGLDSSFLHLERDGTHMHVASTTLFEGPAPPYVPGYGRTAPGYGRNFGAGPGYVRPDRGYQGGRNFQGGPGYQGGRNWGGGRDFGGGRGWNGGGRGRR